MSGPRISYVLLTLAPALCFLVMPVDAQGRADARARAEDLANAASQRFTDILAEKQRQRLAQAEEDWEATVTTEAAEDEPLAPVWNWLERASKHYEDIIVARLRKPSGEVAILVAPQGQGPQRVEPAGAGPAEEPLAQPQLSWNSITFYVREWLARTHRAYRNEIAKQLRLPKPVEVPETAVAEADMAPDAKPATTESQAPDVGSEPSKAAVSGTDEAPDHLEPSEIKRLAEEAEAKRVADEAKRKAEDAAESKRLAAEAEAKRLAEEAEAKRKAEEVAEAERVAKEAEAKRVAEEAEAKRIAEEAEAKRKAEEAESKRLAAEAEAKRKAEEADEAQRMAALKVEEDRAASASEVQDADETTQPSDSEVIRDAATAAAEGAPDMPEPSSAGSAETTGKPGEDAATKPDVEMAAAEEATKQSTDDRSATEPETTRDAEVVRDAATAAAEGAPDSPEPAPTRATVEDVPETPERSPASTIPDTPERSPASAVPETPERGPVRTTAEDVPEAPERAPSRGLPVEDRTPPAAVEKRMASPSKTRAGKRKVRARKAASRKKRASKRHYKKRAKRTRWAKRSAKRWGYRKKGRVYGYRMKGRVYGYRKKVHRRARAIGGRTYVVRRGDTLWGIAKRHYGKGAAYRKIYRANRRKVRNPNRIYPRQRLYIPRRR